MKIFLFLVRKDVQFTEDHNTQTLIGHEHIIIPMKKISFILINLMVIYRYFTGQIPRFYVKHFFFLFFIAKKKIIKIFESKFNLEQMMSQYQYTHIFQQLGT